MSVTVKGLILVRFHDKSPLYNTTTFIIKTVLLTRKTRYRTLSYVLRVRHLIENNLMIHIIVVIIMKEAMMNLSVMERKKKKSTSSKVLIAFSERKSLFNRTLIGSIWQIFSAQKFNLVKK